MSAPNISEQVLAMRRVARERELAVGRPKASRIPSGKAYRRRPKHTSKGWS